MRFNLGEYAKAVELSQKIVSQKLSQRESISERAHLVRALTLNEQHSDALKALQDYLTHLKEMSEWYRCGYGQEATMICFELAGQPFPGAKTAFKQGHQLAKKVRNLPLTILEKAAFAARATDDIWKARSYEAKARAEAKRIGQ